MFQSLKKLLSTPVINNPPDDALCVKLDTIQTKIIEFGNKIKQMVNNNNDLITIFETAFMNIPNTIDAFTNFILDLFNDIRVIIEKPGLYYILTDVSIQKVNLKTINNELTLAEIIKIKCINLKSALINNKKPDEVALISYVCKEYNAFVDILENIGKNFIKPNRFDSNDIKTLYTIIKTNGINTFNEFGSALVAFRSIMNDELTKQVTLNRDIMGDLLNFSKHINEKINGYFNTTNIDYLILKGGNVYKLIKENACRNAIQSTVFEGYLPAINFMPIRKYINEEYCKEVKNNEIELSDWDFTINFNINNTVNIENEIFAGDPAQYFANEQNKEKINQYIEEHTKIYNIIRQIIINELKNYRRIVEVNNTWNGIYEKIKGDFNSKCNVQIKVTESINDTYVYPVSYTKPDEGKYYVEQGFIRADVPYRHHDLNQTRSLSAFNNLYKQCIFKVDLDEEKGTHLRISNMEMFGKNFINDHYTITGFDLIRLTLNFYIDIKLFNTTGDKFYTNDKVYFAELLDYSFSKPATFENYTHGHANYEFTNAIYRQNPKTYEVIKHRSYSIVWFINDIIRMSLESDKGRKFCKRLVRMYESIIYFMIYYEADGYSFIDFTLQNNIMTGKNLLETLLIIKNKSASGDFGFEIFQQVRDILAKIIGLHQNPVNNQQVALHNGGDIEYDNDDVKYNGGDVKYDNDDVKYNGTILKSIAGIVLICYPIIILILCILLLIFILSEYILPYNVCSPYNNFLMST
jgi:hypothetical protein